MSEERFAVESRRSERLVAGLVVGLAAVGIVVLGVLVGAFGRSIPSLISGDKTRLILNGTLAMPDFPVTFVDGSSTTLYREADSSDLLGSLVCECRLLVRPWRRATGVAMCRATTRIVRVSGTIPVQPRRRSG